ncbi:uncharacterized protein ARMOST_06249 [Armillaria ostoyae]|uniref:Uncharacterized protein n=1 Tax=Armillaria ostoyae TaxID=47428 RepID=A0A284R2I2_ARMOS|nr:uncharacterized protein ARMOST_06249 [Armillaria ostoyae]
MTPDDYTISIVSAIGGAALLSLFTGLIVLAYEERIHQFLGVQRYLPTPPVNYTSLDKNMPIDARPPPPLPPRPSFLRVGRNIEIPPPAPATYLAPLPLPDRRSNSSASSSDSDSTLCPQPTYPTFPASQREYWYPPNLVPRWRVPVQGRPDMVTPFPTTNSDPEPCHDTSEYPWRLSPPRVATLVMCSVTASDKRLVGGNDLQPTLNLSQLYTITN